MRILPYRILHGYWCPSSNKNPCCFFQINLFFFAFFVQKCFYFVFNHRGKLVFLKKRRFHGIASNRSSSGLTFLCLFFFLFKLFRSYEVHNMVFGIVFTANSMKCVHFALNITYEFSCMLQIYTIIKAM